MNLVWAEAARAQLESIQAYIGQTSPLYATLTVERLVRRAGQLREFPQSGRAVPERPESTIRELLEPPYRIIYRAEADSVIVLAVIHSRQGSIGAV